MSTTDDEFIAAAWGAVPLFGLEVEEITLLSHSENVVCELRLPQGRRHAMRLHRPGYNTLAQLRSEVEWVTALGNSGVRVPTAIAAPSGEHYVHVEVGGESRYVGVVDWVEGAPLGGPTEAGSDDVVQHYGKIGAIAARIRASNSAWVPPTNFDRRSWSADGLVGDNPLWGRFWEVDALTEAQRSLFRRCRERVRNQLQGLPTGPDNFGLIHADLHLGNLMSNGAELTVIDFDDAGFGWFVHELAVALHPVLDEPWQDDARVALLSGYRSVHPLSQSEEAMIDMFLTMRCLMIIGWLDARKELPIYEHFGDLVAQAQLAAERYLSTRH